MLYPAYEWHRRLTEPARISSKLLHRTLSGLPAPVAELGGTRRLKAVSEIVAGSRPTHVRPDWGIDSVTVAGQRVAVEVRPVLATPFATLLHFATPGVTGRTPTLLVGPISGHFATLLRPTVRMLLSDHDVYVLDWHNARDVPVEEGRFGLDEYIDHVLAAMRHLGPGHHALAVCQPAPLVLAAVALLAVADDPAQPRSLTLMAGPIDTRVNPNRINELAARRPLSFYERFLVSRVPRRYAGAGRRVYPGLAQLTAFLSMNTRRHLGSHVQLYRALVAGDGATARRIRDFYDEYGAVMDVPAEFYLETLQHVFMEHALPRGEFVWRGQRVDLAAIRRTALLTVEGAEDDLCSPGQTEAAHGLCTGIPADDHHHHLQSGVGHYGVFAGSRWSEEIYPVFRDFVAARSAARTASSSGSRVPHARIGAAR
ncbi:polyhydroxyalkanoate depolymerase [Pseudonocardia lutea]|jgi:poly(3-hydroxybutyrate) depolymerase|uniref:Polyhydroxyalkanoate depolymerase n=1 Tax=Pseudonocardia lutea TaxID=2172015 RepID=A0ABW1IE64_9PSEU